MLDVRRIAIAALTLGAASLASAQVVIDYEDNVPATPDGTTTSTMQVNWTNDTNVGVGGISSLQMELNLPDGVTLEACNAGAALGGSDHTIAVCDDGTSGPDTFTIAWFSLSNSALPDGVIATLDFTVAVGTTFGTKNISLTDLTNNALNSMADTDGNDIAIQPGTNFNGDGGSLIVDCPVGTSCYASTPDLGSNIAFGSAVVNQATGQQTIGVSNLQDDATTTFDVTSGTGGSGTDVTIAASTPGGFPATVPADGGTTVVDVNFTCTPTARGDKSGTLQIENTSDDQSPNAEYPFTCTGLSPNVQVPAGPITLSGTVAGSDPSTAITVSNPQDGFTSTANNLSASGGAGDTQITVSGGPTNLPAGDTFDFTVSCDSSTETTYTRTIDFSWDDPAGSGTASVNVECTISDTAPIYESDPTPGSTISLSAQFGTQAGPDGVDVRNANTNNAADDLIINSATADDPIFNVSVVNSTFSPNGSFDGSNDVQVTCTPQGVGTVSGTLTVDTNDPNQSGGGFTYPLNCIGTGSVITSTPAAGGTLNLGSVAPGSASPTQPIEFTNNHISDSYSVSCSVSDPDGVFDWTPDPIQFTVSPGQTESVFFQGTPPDIATYSATVDCTGNVTRGSAFSAQYTVTVTGRPLVIPTLNHWGLLLMSLIVLALGGLAGRRLMA